MRFSLTIVFLAAILTGTGCGTTTKLHDPVQITPDLQYQVLEVRSENGFLGPNIAMLNPMLRKPGFDGDEEFSKIKFLETFNASTGGVLAALISAGGEMGAAALRRPTRVNVDQQGAASSSAKGGDGGEGGDGGNSNSDSSSSSSASATSNP